MADPFCMFRTATRLAQSQQDFDELGFGTAEFVVGVGIGGVEDCATGQDDHHGFQRLVRVGDRAAAHA